MNNIKAGVVVVTEFCRSEGKTFSGYVSYIDREDSQRQEHLSQYNLYNDYMDNIEKTTGIFTKEKFNLKTSDKRIVKECFKTAQDNGSLMWQTVISFDNSWLEQYGLYDSKTNILDEQKIKEIASGSIEKMLKNECLENAIWSAAIHYDTDNVHVHIAIVEQNPRRIKKPYKQYHYELNKDGKYIKNVSGIFLKANKKNNLNRWGIPFQRYDRKPLLNPDGSEVWKDEYVGRFKGKSIELCKSHIVNSIVQQKEQNLLINKVLREQIIKNKQNNSLISDADLKDKFIEIHKSMPKKGNRGLWNYNNNAMKELRLKIDSLTDAYLEKYHKDEYLEMKVKLAEQSIIYKTAYGDTDRDYKDNKIKDFYVRMGNAILKEIKEYDKNLENLNKSSFGELEKEVENEEQLSKPALPQTYGEWEEKTDFIEMKQEPIVERKFSPSKRLEYLEKSANQENEYAQLRLGILYLKGEVVERNKETAKVWLEKSAHHGNEYAINMLKNIDNNPYPYRTKGYSQKYAGYELERSLAALRRSLNDACQSAINRKEYEKLTQQCSQEQER